MEVLPSPCDSCPYRRDHPAGVWHRSEYEKLRQYDDNSAIELFLCHQSTAVGREIVCRGWLSVHCESVSVRLMILRGLVTVAQVYAKCKAALFASGSEAADHGESRLRNPPAKAVRMTRKLARKRIAKRHPLD